MKPGLRRIEATLNQLYGQSNSPSQTTSGGATTLESKAAIASSSPASHQIYSFKVQPDFFGNSSAVGHETVQPFPVQDNCPQPPNLPKFKLPSFSNHRHAANPGLALSLLKEMETVVVGWQTELRQILIQLQEIYLEGPIVDGWLESDSREPRSHNNSDKTSDKNPFHDKEGANAVSAAVATLRHAEVDRLMDFVQELSAAPPASNDQDSALRTGYRLCGLDADGQPWSRPCPPNQVPQVSLAIARYQKLRQLLGRKQILEARLNQFAQDLIGLHSRLQ